MVAEQFSMAIVGILMPARHITWSHIFTGMMYRTITCEFWGFWRHSIIVNEFVTCCTESRIRCMILQVVRFLMWNDQNTS